MSANWKDKVSCAMNCSRCMKNLIPEDERILSVYDHEAICMDCKKKEEKRDDYAMVSQEMIGKCMIDYELQQSDPGAYCYHHFYPYKCS